jgi:hypothetical protein
MPRPALARALAGGLPDGPPQKPLLVGPPPQKPVGGPEGPGAPKGGAPEASPVAAGPSSVGPSAPAEGTTPTGAAGGSASRPAQSDTLPTRGQDAIAQTLGGPLQPGEATLDSIAKALDVRNLDLGLSSGAESELAKPGYDGRMISENGQSYAFAFEQEAAQSADALGVPRDEHLLMVQSEEAGHASARSRFPNISASDNEVVGEAVSSRVNPQIQTLTAMTDMLASSKGQLDQRYDQSVDIGKQALADTLGPGANPDAFVAEFGRNFSNGTTAREALSETASAHLARTGSTQTAESFVSTLEQNMSQAYQSAAASILESQPGGGTMVA